MTDDFQAELDYIEALTEQCPGWKLTETQREALYLRLEGLSFGEIGQELGIVKGSAQSRVSGAIRTMEKFVEEQDVRRARLAEPPSLRRATRPGGHP